MQLCIQHDKQEVGREAAATATLTLQRALRERGEANLILATGASQFEMLQQLVQADVDWAQVTCFHLDEYLGMPNTHPASFCRYLRERFVEPVESVKTFHWIQGDCVDPQAECERLATIIQRHPIDVACVGIGENAHLAFNDPPADFETEAPYLVVDLDEACRRQQMGEGWFATLEEVPQQAISMSIQQIMKSASIVCTVPDERKAQAVQAAVEGPVTPEFPASILQRHAQLTLVLDRASASKLAQT